jgi:aspartyl-tRNA(Asn)/glutamyl-tRNA(Gln) amidotransferase subunit B
VAHGQLGITPEGGAAKTVNVVRAHLEEDAGKSLHEDFHGMSGIDLNRAGTPLLEVVTAPDLRSAAEAVAYLKKLHTLVRYLGVSDGNMQEGSFRCDANVSIRPRGSDRLGTRAEIKNLNSFRFVEQAIEFEIARQIEVLEGGGKVVQETRLYDPDRHETRSMRSKEEAYDYRYFPDPDLLPVVVDETFIADVRRSLPELPDAKRERFVRDYGLSAYEAEVLTASRELADFYEGSTRAGAAPKAAANWVMGEVLGALNKEGREIGDSPVSPEMLGGLLRRIEDNTISGKLAKQVFEAMWAGEGDADAVIAKKGLRQITDSGAIEQAVDKVLADNPQQVEQYRAGKDKVLGFLVGQIMKATQGKANPAQVNELLLRKLKQQ